MKITDLIERLSAVAAAHPDADVRADFGADGEEFGVVDVVAHGGVVNLEIGDTDDWQQADWGEDAPFYYNQR